MAAEEASRPIATSSPGPASDRPARLKAHALVAWATLRLIALLAVLYLLRDRILSGLVDPERLTLLAIDIISTPAARLLFFVGLAAALTALCVGVKRLWPGIGDWIAIAAGALLILIVFRATGSSYVRALVPIAVLAANLLPDRVLDRVLPTERARSSFMAFAVGAAELFFFRRYVAWVLRLLTGRTVAIGNVLSVLIAVVMASALAAVLVKSHRLVGIEQAVRMPSTARILAEGDFNWIEMDPAGKRLLATGHGFAHVMGYDVRDFTREPMRSSVETGYAQGFAQDKTAGELYVSTAGKLLVLDAASLELKRTFLVTGLASGDPWIASDHASNTITIVSEADLDDGSAFMVLDRTTGEVRATGDYDAGHILLVPERSRLYLSFFRRRNSLMIYDLAKLAVTKETAAPHHSDRMAHLPESNELLLAVPIESRIARFDAETLETKGDIRAILGVRTLRIDDERGLLLCASLVTGEVAIIDLETSRIVSRIYLGPWLRSIEIDPARAMAYVSSKGALYEIDYGQLR